MRKNKVLTEIDGGICAPAGFRANAVCAGIYKDCRLPERAQAEEDIALISAKGRYPTACVYAQGRAQGAPVVFNRKHLKGYARAIFINSGVANVCGAEAMKHTLRVCDEVAKRLVISRDEIVMASTGEICSSFPTQTIVNGLDALVAGLDVSAEKSLATARAIMTTDRLVKQRSYAYMQGDYPCKFGVVSKGCARVAPNMATTLCFLTTDVNISPAMLQRALTSVTNETFNLLNVDGIASPNDTVCIMSSCLAGNYIISTPDTEYKKFYVALKAVCEEVCKQIVAECGRLMVCSVKGARSSRIARMIAKSLACSERIKSAFRKKTVSPTDIICAIGAVEETFSIDFLRVSIVSAQGELVLVEDGNPLPYLNERFADVLDAEENRLCIDLKQGNYTAEAMCAL